jgi:hypothetical protein
MTLYADEVPRLYRVLVTHDDNHTSTGTFYASSDEEVEQAKDRLGEVFWLAGEDVRIEIFPA